MSEAYQGTKEYTRYHFIIVINKDWKLVTIATDRYLIAIVTIDIILLM